MKKVLVILMLFFAFGCSEETTAPVESELVGKWKTTYNGVDEEGTSFNELFILEFNINGTLSLTSQQPSRLTINLTGTYSVSGDVLTIINNACGDLKGGYKFEFKDNGVDIKEIQDECGNNSFLPRFYYHFDEVFAEKLLINKKPT
jgi:uncharacterized protein (TIGR03066 family)